MDTADPEVKRFYIKEWPKHEGGYNWSGIKDDGSGPIGSVRFISVLSYFNDEFDCGEVEARYRITGTLETPPGYVGAYEGTTKPAPKIVEAVSEGDEQTRLMVIEDKIMSVLESGGRMVLSALKRKTHAYRFPDWDTCLKNLEQQGELTTETDGAGRVWVCTTSVSH